MLTLSRCEGESVIIHTPAGDVTVNVFELTHARVKLGISAPRQWAIERSASDLSGSPAASQIEGTRGADTPQRPSSNGGAR